MQQYWDVKSAHMDKILFFRMGDFFEIFDQDAITVAPILGITLTVRNKKSGDTTKMCGMPHHSIAASLNKLLAEGYKVAICDQLEDPKNAKGLVKRGITRILSPGMVFDPEMLEADKSNYIASYDEKSISFLEASTGECFFYDLKRPTDRDRLLQVLNPTELLISKEEKERLLNEKISLSGPHLTDFNFDKSIEENLKQIAPQAIYNEDFPCSAKKLLAYCVYMQDAEVLNNFRPFEKRYLQKHLELSPAVVRHLELFENSRGEKKGSLFSSINRCKTSAGARLLKRYMNFPLYKKSEIEAKLDRVEYWVEKHHNNDATASLQEIREALSFMGDIERRLSKVNSPTCNAKDLQSMANALRAGLQATILSTEFNYDNSAIIIADELIKEIDSTIIEEPPSNIKKGYFIQEGLSDVLDEYITLSTNAQTLLNELEAREKEKYGITSLKIRYNNVFGYYIEITNTHKDKVPEHYLRKQTLSNSERYTTEELQTLERKVLSAKTKRVELELEIFENLRKKIVAHNSQLLKLADQWSELDLATAFAWLAIEQNYCRPEFSTDRSINLKMSRHPVVEQEVDGEFVANNIQMQQGQCMLLTGPNMAGKSTIMRQLAVTALMAQMGAFVPATEAKIALYDQIFTRIGASDFLAEGLSTFMVEMLETAEIIKNVSDESLVIFDEVGRGTSTYDGMSLAQAILEYLIEKTQATSMFATHYHEMTALVNKYRNLLNYHMAIKDVDGEVRFLHKLVSGPANKSYGIHVAKLAGLPKALTKRAERILAELEDPTKDQMSLMSLDFEQLEAKTNTDSVLLENPYEEFITQVQNVSLQEMTPLDALNTIAKWQKSLS